MKYISIILIIVLVLITGCTINENIVNTTTSIIDAPILTPVPTIEEIKIIHDPIVGSWLNGMTCFDNGTLISINGIEFWKNNDKASYFIIDKNNYATEWVYNSNSDCIKERSSSESVCRGILKIDATPKSTLKFTTISCDFECIEIISRGSENFKFKSDMIDLDENKVLQFPTQSPSYNYPSPPSYNYPSPSSPPSLQPVPLSPVSVKPVFTLPPANQNSGGKEYITPVNNPDIVMKSR